MVGVGEAESTSIDAPSHEDGESSDGQCGTWEEMSDSDEEENIGDAALGMVMGMQRNLNEDIEGQPDPDEKDRQDPNVDFEAKIDVKDWLRLRTKKDPDLVMHRGEFGRVTLRSVRWTEGNCACACPNIFAMRQSSFLASDAASFCCCRLSEGN